MFKKLIPQPVERVIKQTASSNQNQWPEEFAVTITKALETDKGRGSNELGSKAKTQMDKIAFKAYRDI